MAIRKPQVESCVEGHCKFMLIGKETMYRVQGRRENLIGGGEIEWV